MRKLIETNFGLVLIAACVIGVAVPPFAMLPDFSASVALAMLTYASCFKLRDGGFSQINWNNIFIFYAVRYIILPIAMFMLAQRFFPQYAAGIFLLALLPTAVSSPAFANMFGGSVPPAFAIVIVSTILAPFLIPLQCSLMLAGSDIAPTPMPLFRTLVLCVFFPMLLYFFSRKHKKISDLIYDNVKLISIILVFFVIALVIAKQREVILENTISLILPSLLAVFCYALFLACGWYFAGKQTDETRISIATCSGFNNVALGVSIALLHFPQNVILFVAVSEAAWATLPMMFSWFLRKKSVRKMVI